MLRLMKWSVAPAMALVLFSAAPSAAEVQATVMMKSGDRHSGTNPRHRPDKGEFALRKSLAEEFRVPGDSVAFVDFGGAPDVDPKISGGQWAAVMRNGNVVRGQLIEMGHTNPSDTSSEYLVIFRDENGQEHRWPSNQVGRVYFPGGVAPTSGTSGSTATSSASSGSGLVVSGKQRWTQTGMLVRRGEVVTFNTTGQIQLSTDNADIATAGGSKAGRTSPNAPVAAQPAGALIARIGNGQPFLIGDQQSITMPASGQLFLSVNDDHLDDNTGEFRVEIRRSGRR